MKVELLTCIITTSVYYTLSVERRHHSSSGVWMFQLSVVYLRSEWEKLLIHNIHSCCEVLVTEALNLIKKNLTHFRSVIN